MLRLSAVVTCLLAGLVSGCGGGEEQALIRNYFTAARVNDRTTLGNIATVPFDPQEDGVMMNPSVESVTPEERRPLRARELAEALQKARDDQEAFNTKMKEYQDANVEAVTRVLEAERATKPVTARDRDVQAAWTKWREDTKQHAKALSDAQAALNEESEVASASVFDPNNPVDVTTFDGELITKQVTINGTVRKGEQREDRTMNVTLQRAILQGKDGQMIAGRWIITAIS
jgi:hypothetical protein